MVGGFSTNHAVRSGTNLELCSRCLNVITHALILESQLKECENKTISFIFLYAPNKPALPGKLHMTLSEMSHDSTP